MIIIIRHLTETERKLSEDGHRIIGLYIVCIQSVHLADRRLEVFCTSGVL